MISLAGALWACAQSTDIEVVVSDGSVTDGSTADTAFEGSADGAGQDAEAPDASADATADAAGDAADDAPTGDTGADAQPDAQPTAGLGLWFKFDATTGNVFDHAGNNNSGTISGSVQTGIPGKDAMAFDFSGDGRVQVKSSTSLDMTTGGTIELWIKLSSVTAGAIVSRGTGNNDNSVRIRTTQGNVQVLFARVGGSAAIVTSDADVLGNQWTHVAAVNTGSQLELYIDAVLHKTSTGGQLGPIFADLYVGKNAGTDNAFNGVIDDLRWWTVARTEAEICQDAGGTVSLVDGASVCSLP